MLLWVIKIKEFFWLRFPFCKMLCYCIKLRNSREVKRQISPLKRQLPFFFFSWLSIHNLPFHFVGLLPSETSVGEKPHPLTQQREGNMYMSPPDRYSAMGLRVRLMPLEAPHLGCWISNKWCKRGRTFGIRSEQWLFRRRQLKRARLSVSHYSGDMGPSSNMLFPRRGPGRRCRCLSPPAPVQTCFPESLSLL